ALPGPERPAGRARRRRLLRAHPAGGRMAAAGPAAMAASPARRAWGGGRGARGGGRGTWGGGWRAWGGGRWAWGGGRGTWGGGWRARQLERPRPGRVFPRPGAGAGMSAITELPVFGLALTLSVYLLSALLYQRLGRPGLLSPVLVTVIGVALVLEVTGLPYAVYMQQVTVLTLLLGPATVALALPLLRNGRALLSSAPAVLVTLVVGGAVSVAVTVGAMVAFGAGEDMLLAALPRSVTSPVGLSLAET